MYKVQSHLSFDHSESRRRNFLLSFIVAYDVLKMREKKRLYECATHRDHSLVSVPNSETAQYKLHLLNIGKTTWGIDLTAAHRSTLGCIRAIFIR